MAEFVEISVDAARPLALLKNGGKKLAYAVVNALNDTAKAIQQKEREHVLGSFVVRKRDFVLRQAAIIKFASVGKDRYEASISVGQKPRLLLSGFEKGAERRPTKGGRTQAVPVTGGPARPSRQASVPDVYFFQSLQLRRVTSKGQRKRRQRTDVGLVAHETSTGRVQFKGAHRTFLLPSTARAPEGGVFQRVGPGRDDIRLVYSFKSHVKPLDSRLRFIVTGRSVAAAVFPRELQRQVRNAFLHTVGFA